MLCLRFVILEIRHFPWEYLLQFVPRELRKLLFHDLAKKEDSIYYLFSTMRDLDRIIKIRVCFEIPHTDSLTHFDDIRDLLYFEPWIHIGNNRSIIDSFLLSGFPAEISKDAKKYRPESQSGRSGKNFPPNADIRSTWQWTWATISANCSASLEGDSISSNSETFSQNDVR